MAAHQKHWREGKRGQTEAGGAETTPKRPEQRTREEHVEEVARWQRLVDSTRAWSGRGRLSALGKDGDWLAAQPSGKEFRAQTAHMSRARRREALEVICETARDEALEAATSVTEQEEQDEILVKMQEAIACDARAGGAYTMLWEVLNKARGRGAGGGAKLTAVYEDDDRARGVEKHGSEAVREHARELGERINQDRPVAMEVVRAIMGMGGAAKAAPAVDGDWVEALCTWERFLAGLEKAEPQKGVGCDGWNSYLMRRAPEPVQRRYFAALKNMIRTRAFPEEWREKVAMLFMKPGEDPCELGRRRDIWLECHGLKLTMWMLGEEYERATAGVMPVSQAGNVQGRGCPEQTLVMRCQKDQCAVEQTMCCRAYLDLGVFFMSCVREVQWEAERWCGVRPDVTKVVRALYDGACGRYETAYGLTETFPLRRGNTQGCNQSPNRSKMQLRMMQEAVRRLCEGFRFRGAEASTPQLWYCDDGAFMTNDLHMMQLVLDTCWMVTRAAGLNVQIKADKKTAWQASYWKGGVEVEVTDWEMRLPDGRVVPRVAKEYTYLGSAEPATWEQAQEGVRKKVIRTCSQLLRMVGRAGGHGCGPASPTSSNRTPRRRASCATNSRHCLRQPGTWTRHL